MSSRPPKREDKQRARLLQVCDYLLRDANRLAPSKMRSVCVLERMPPVPVNSSRIASHIVRQREAHKLRHVITKLLEYVPEEEKQDPLLQELAKYH
jgi:hypothetical protein